MTTQVESFSIGYSTPKNPETFVISKKVKYLSMEEPQIKTEKNLG
jgi:hypothetical protein